MEAANFEMTVIALKNRKPFRPFTLSMMNGERLEIDFPDAIAIREGTAVFLGPGKVMSFVDPDGVTRIIDDIAHPHETLA